MRRVGWLLQIATLAIFGVIGMSCVSAAPADEDEEPVIPSAFDFSDAPVVELHKILKPEQWSFVANAQDTERLALELVAHRSTWDAVKDTDASVDLKAVLAAQLIEADLRGGFDTDAIDLFRALDTPVKQRLLHGKGVCARDHHMLFVALNFHPRTLGAKLAFALAQAGDTKAAHQILQQMDSFPEHADVNCGSALSVRHLPECVAAILAPAATFDIFRWRFGRAERGANACVDWSDAREYQREAERRFTAAHIPEAWRYGVHTATGGYAGADREDAIADYLKTQPALQGQLEALQIRLDAADTVDQILVARLSKLASSWPSAVPASTTPASAADRQLAARIEAAWKTPPYDPFSVKAQEKSAATAKIEKECIPPDLRCAMDGKQRWSLRVSSSLDPTGEVPAAAYWLRRSEPDGAKVREFYLGIREHLPYSLSEQVSAVLVENGRLQLDMHYSRMDTEAVSFPPIRLAIQDAGNYRLEASIDDIARDSDGDGLTDLAEDRMMLDPHAVDSDGDGIADAVDAFPNVALRRASSESDQAMAAALSFLSAQGDEAISFGVPGSENFVKRSRAINHTLFVRADPEDLAGLDGNARVIVVPKSLDDKLLKSRPGFDVFYPTTFSLQMSPGGGSATLQWSARWRGGTLALFRRGNVWEVGEIDGWIT